MRDRIGRAAVILLCLGSLSFGQQAEKRVGRGGDLDLTTLPAEDGGLGNKLVGGPNDVHALIIDEPQMPAEGPPEVFTSRIIETAFPFNDVLPSWNVDVPAGAAFTAEIRVGRRAGDFWTPFYFLGTWGRAESFKGKHLHDEHGTINLDYFQSHREYDRVQYRFTLEAGAEGRRPVPRRVGLAYSNTLNNAELARKFRKAVDPGPKEQWARRLPVSFRSQFWESPRIGSLICSPTSVSMVLEYRGVKRPTEVVADRMYDPAYKLYGNWWRAVQAAYSWGVPGHVERFGDWNAVKRYIANGQPVIASIRINKGEMSHKPERQSNGHLIVIVGFTAEGDVLVNDPVGKTVEDGTATYKRADMEKVWLERGGVAYILEPREGGGPAGKKVGS
jgi:hypothetical protein